MLLRFYDPDNGTVCLDGKDIREYNPHWLRQQMGIVSQVSVRGLAGVGQCSKIYFFFQKICHVWYFISFGFWYSEQMQPYMYIYIYAINSILYV